MKVKISIKVQSISDVITNSSSEAFLRVATKDNDLFHEIFETLEGLFPGRDWELSPVVYDVTEDDYWKEKYGKDGYYCAVLDLPYGIEDTDFYAEGIKAILKNRYGEDNYFIEIL